MTLNAIVKEDGTLIAKVPKSLWGKQVKVMINMGGTTRVSRNKRFLWEKVNSRSCKMLTRRLFQRRNLPTCSRLSSCSAFAREARWHDHR